MRDHSGESSGSGASVSAAAESGTCRLSIRPYGICSVSASHSFTNTVQFTQSWVGSVSVGVATAVQDAPEAFAESSTRGRKMISAVARASHSSWDLARRSDEHENIQTHNQDHRAAQEALVAGLSDVKPAAGKDLTTSEAAYGVRLPALRRSTHCPAEDRCRAADGTGSSFV